MVSHDQGVLCRVPQERELQKKAGVPFSCIFQSESYLSPLMYNIDIDLVKRFVCLHPPGLSGIGLLVAQLKINLVLT
jgi:hypothetical protein